MSGYVQCPSCKTIFTVTAQQLDAHDGLVRCGQCRDIFNGTWNLVDELPGAGGSGDGAAESAPTIGPLAAASTERDDRSLAPDTPARQVDDSVRSSAKDETARHLPPITLTTDWSATEEDIDRDTEPVTGDAAGHDRESTQPVTLPTPILREIETAAEQVSSLDDDSEQRPPALIEEEARGSHATEQDVFGEPAALDSTIEETEEESAPDSVSGESANELSVGAMPGDESADADQIGDTGLEPAVDASQTESLEATLPGIDAVTAAAQPALGDSTETADQPSPAKDNTDHSSTEPSATASGDGSAAVSADEAPSDATATDSTRTTADGDAALEEIVIEAPPNLWNAFEDGGSGGGQPAADSDMAPSAVAIEHPKDTETDRLEAGLRSLLDPIEGADEPAAVNGEGKTVGDMSQQQDAAKSASGTEITREMVRPKIGQDVKLVEIPRPRPLQTIAWILAALVLLGVVAWQLKQYYLNDLAQYPALRPYLTKACEVLECAVPPRNAFKLIDLVGTSVNAHPHAPGALRVSVNLVNRAQFEQLYPPLEITLTDTSGRVVGRRTYAPAEYLADGSKLLPPSVIQQVDLDLAQPSEAAIGYEIQLVKR